MKIYLAGITQTAIVKFFGEKMLLILKRKWYDKLLAGEKEEDYRDIKPYYTTRLQNILGKEKMSLLLQGKEVLLGDVVFKLGYKKDACSFTEMTTVRIGKGNPKWGADGNRDQYIFRLLIHVSFDCRGANYASRNLSFRL